MNKNAIKLSVNDNIWESFNSFEASKREKNILEGEISEDNEICKFCNQSTLINITSEGISLCTDENCGAINDVIIDSKAEWRYYGISDSKCSDPTRCGLPTNLLLPESSLGSIVLCNGRSSYEMRKIKKYHTWNAMPYKERSLYGVFDTMTIRAVNNGISACIVEDAKLMYKKLSEHRISRGANRKGLIASCIYIACKLKKVPRSAKEIAEIFKLDITNTTKGRKKFLEIWNNINKEKNINAVPTKSNDFIIRFCSKLHISGTALKLCQYVTKKADKFGIVSENTPPSIAAGSIYLVSVVLNLEITKKSISQVCKISEVTISKCFKKLEKYKQYILPKQLVSQ